MPVQPSTVILLSCVLQYTICMLRARIIQRGTEKRVCAAARFRAAATQSEVHIALQQRSGAGQVTEPGSRS
jgi:hypothetical protein